jgi:RHS repeat-associated protein
MKLRCTLMGALSLFACFQITHAVQELPGVPAQSDAYWAESAKAIKSTNSAPPIGEPGHYTGKVFDSESRTYTFLCRNYDPELSRWTSADPSGFQDGTNDQKYVPVPTNQLDAFGLWTIALTSQQTEWDDQKSGIDEGLIYSWNWTLGLAASASTTEVGGYASARSDKYNDILGGGPVDSNSSVLLEKVQLWLTEDGYLRTNAPSGGADQDDNVSAGVAIRASGFDGTSRSGSITVELKSGYEGVVSYSAQSHGLSWAEVPGVGKFEKTITFNYEVRE